MNALANATSDKLKSSRWIVEIEKHSITYSACSEPGAEPTCVFSARVTKSGVYVTYPRYDLEDNLVSFDEAKNIIMELNELNDFAIDELIEFASTCDWP